MCKNYCAMDHNIRKLLPKVLDLLLDTVFIVDMSGTLRYVSQSCERIFGYTQEEMIGLSMISLVAPEDRERTQEEARKVMAGFLRVGFENRYIRKDGRLVHIMWSARFAAEEQMRIGVARDITQRKHLQAMQAATYAVFEAAQKSSDLSVLSEALLGVVKNLMSVSVFGVVTGDTVYDLRLDYLAGDGSLHDNNHKQAVLAHAAAVIQRRQPASFDTRGGVIDTGSVPPHDVRWLAAPLIADALPLGAIVMKSHDVTCFSDKDAELLEFVALQLATALDRKRLHDELVRFARYDELTGLPNRRVFYQRINDALSYAKARNGRVALLFVDIDDFKRVNDRYGHVTGDRVLQVVANRLKSCLRQDDVVFRLGGDEFVVLLDDIRLVDDAAIVARKIQDAVAPDLAIDTIAIRPSITIGTAVYPEHGKTSQELLAHADKQMYMNKT
jgi:diguanylate cyclase (GGDEF)-like protein/PAS domain S-box-containing protein